MEKKEVCDLGGCLGGINQERENSSYKEVSAWERVRAYVWGREGLEIIAALDMLSVKGCRTLRGHVQ